MKLSEKGFEKFWETFSRKTGIELYPSEIDALDEAIANHEFEPDDFQDAVILTAEEANLLFKVIDGFFDLRLPTTKEIVALNKLKVRVERIAKAEKCNE